MNISELNRHKKFWTLEQKGREYVQKEVEATCQSAQDDVFIYVEDKLWGRDITSQDLAKFERALHHESGPESVDPNSGILAIERKLFEKERTPVTILLTDSQAQFEGFFTPMDLLPDQEAQYYGGRSNELPMVHLNVGKAKNHLAPVFSHEVQHLFHQHQDEDEETWMRELLAQAAMNLTGHRDTQLEAASNAHISDPIVTSESEMANYSGLTKFAATLQKRFGPDFIAQLSANPANGIESINATLRQSGHPDESFDSVFRAHLVSEAENYNANSASKRPLESYAVGPQGGVLNAPISPGAARFVRLAHDESIAVKVEGMQKGVFLEQLSFKNGQARRENLIPNDGWINLPPGPSRYLMFGSSGPTATVNLSFENLNSHPVSP